MFFSAWGRRRTLNERNAGVSDVGVARDPFPAAPKRTVDAPQSSEKSNLIADDDDEQHVSPTNEADTDEREVSVTANEVAALVATFLEKQRLINERLVLFYFSKIE